MYLSPFLVMLICLVLWQLSRAQAHAVPPRPALPKLTSARRAAYRARHPRPAPPRVPLWVRGDALRCGLLLVLGLATAVLCR
jgi:hypothetical protein